MKRALLGQQVEYDHGALLLQGVKKISVNNFR